MLKAKQKLLEIKDHRLLNDVATRWNSSYDMLDRFLQQQPVIEATLLSKDIKKNAKEINTLSGDDYTAAEEVVNILKPIKIIKLYYVMNTSRQFL